jgi:hypothetical protein
MISGKFSRKKVWKRAVRTMLIVIISPSFQLFLRVLQRYEPVCVIQFPKASIEGFLVGVVRRISGAGEPQTPLFTVRPSIKRSGDKLRPAVRLDILGDVALRNNPLKDPADFFRLNGIRIRRQALVALDFSLRRI